MDVTNDSEHETFDPNTSSISPGELEIIAQIERLEEQNAEFHNIDGIEDLFVHYGRSDSRLLDEMVAEFGLQCPDFDIFNYVDPLLDAALDADGAEALDAIDCEIQQSSDINLNSLSEDYVVANREELTMLKHQLKYQQETISQLHTYLSGIVETHRASSEVLLDETQQLQHQTQESIEHVSFKMQFDIPEIGDDAPTNEQSPLSDSGYVQEVCEIESLQSNISDVSLNEEPHTPPPLHVEHNFNRFEDSMRMQKIRITWNGSDDDKQFTCQLVGSEISNVRDVQKNDKMMMNWATSGKIHFAK